MKRIKYPLQLIHYWTPSPPHFLLWRREWLPTPVFLPGESHGQRSLADYSLWGHKALNTTEWLTLLHSRFPLSAWLWFFSFIPWFLSWSRVPPSPKKSGDFSLFWPQDFCWDPWNNYSLTCHLAFDLTPSSLPREIARTHWPLMVGILPIFILLWLDS